MTNTNHYWHAQNGQHLRYNSANELLGTLVLCTSIGQWLWQARGGTSQKCGFCLAQAKIAAIQSITHSTDKERQLLFIRLNSPLRPMDRTSAPVDGLGLFDAVRSPALL